MLSVIIITKNEAINIRACLESVKWADEIIVIDSGSSDQTVTIAKEYTDKVHSTDWQGFGIQKQRALSCATGDWILNLDADEVVSSLLKKEIIAAIDSNAADAYRVPIRMHFYGKPLRYSSSPKRHVRLFKKEGARYSADIVHEKILLPGGTRISKLSTALIHDSYRDISYAIDKMNLYSSYSAKIRIEAKKTTTLSRIIIAAMWMFFRCFVLQRGFMDGKEGYLCALFNAQSSFYRGIKQLYHDRALSNLPKV